MDKGTEFSNLLILIFQPDVVNLWWYIKRTLLDLTELIERNWD